MARVHADEAANKTTPDCRVCVCLSRVGSGSSNSYWDYMKLDLQHRAFYGAPPSRCMATNCNSCLLTLLPRFIFLNSRSIL